MNQLILVPNIVLLQSFYRYKRVVYFVSMTQALDATPMPAGYIEFMIFKVDYGN